MQKENVFIPELAIRSGVTDIDFYKKAFDAVELWRIANEDKTIHVAAFSLNGNEFRVHEERKHDHIVSPLNANGTTVKITLAAENVSEVMAKAIAAGATEIAPVTDFEYGYRQGELKDPFGHHWVIENLFDPQALKDFVKSVEIA